MRKLFFVASTLAVLALAFCAADVSAQGKKGKGKGKGKGKFDRAKIAQFIFKRYDADKNGKVTKKEYETGRKQQWERIAKKFGKKFDKAKAEKRLASQVALFEKHDKGADGMDQEEFSKFFAATFKGKGGKGGKGKKRNND